MDRDVNPVGRANGANPDEYGSVSGPHRARGSAGGSGSVSWSDRVADMDLADLRALVDTMPVIEQARGMVMVHCNVDAASAMTILRRSSQSANVKLRSLCREIVAAANEAADRGEALRQRLDRL